MSREYNVFGSSLTVAGAVTLNAQCNLATGSSAEFLRYWVGQSGSATSAQVRIALATIATTIGLTVVQKTPVAIKPSDPASKWTSSSTTLAQGLTGINASAETGTKVQVWEDAFNQLNGFLKVNTPNETEWLTSSATSSALSMYFPTSPTLTTSWSWGWTFREIG